jgi:hypothetical protein
MTLPLSSSQDGQNVDQVQQLAFGLIGSSHSKKNVFLLLIKNMEKRYL